MGHSLGGTLAREIVERLYKNEQKPSFVIMLDPWATGVENLDEQVITEKLEVCKYHWLHKPLQSIKHFEFEKTGCSYRHFCRNNRNTMSLKSTFS